MRALSPSLMQLSPPIAQPLATADPGGRLSPTLLNSARVAAAAMVVRPSAGPYLTTPEPLMSSARPLPLTRSRVARGDLGVLGRLAGGGVRGVLAARGRA